MADIKLTSNTIAGKSADELELEGHERIAEGHALLAAAARVRAKTVSPLGDWVRVDALPIPKSAALAACRSGELRAVKRGRSWLTTRADADAFLAKAPPAKASNSTDDDLRRELGLERRRAS
jgi:hypothetical protein